MFNFSAHWVYFLFDNMYNNEKKKLLQLYAFKNCQAQFCLAFVIKRYFNVPKLWAGAYMLLWTAKCPNGH